MYLDISRIEDEAVDLVDIYTSSSATNQTQFNLNNSIIQEIIIMNSQNTAYNLNKWIVVQVEQLKTCAFFHLQLYFYENNLKSQKVILCEDNSKSVHKKCAVNLRDQIPQNQTTEQLNLQLDCFSEHCQLHTIVSVIYEERIFNSNYSEFIKRGFQIIKLLQPYQTVRHIQITSQVREILLLNQQKPIEQQSLLIQGTSVLENNQNEKYQGICQFQFNQRTSLFTLPSSCSGSPGIILLIFLPAFNSVLSLKWLKNGLEIPYQTSKQFLVTFNVIFTLTDSNCIMSFPDEAKTTIDLIPGSYRFDNYNILNITTNLTCSNTAFIFMNLPNINNVRLIFVTNNNSTDEMFIGNESVDSEFEVCVRDLRTTNNLTEIALTTFQSYESKLLNELQIYKYSYVASSKELAAITGIDLETYQLVPNQKLCFPVSQPIQAIVFKGTADMGIFEYQFQKQTISFQSQLSIPGDFITNRKGSLKISSQIKSIIFDKMLGFSSFRMILQSSKINNVNLQNLQDNESNSEQQDNHKMITGSKESDSQEDYYCFYSPINPQINSLFKMSMNSDDQTAFGALHLEMYKKLDELLKYMNEASFKEITLLYHDAFKYQYSGSGYLSCLSNCIIGLTLNQTETYDSLVEIQVTNNRDMIAMVICQYEDHYFIISRSDGRNQIFIPYEFKSKVIQNDQLFIYFYGVFTYQISIMSQIIENQLVYLPFRYTDTLSIPLELFKNYGRRVLLVYDIQTHLLSINEVYTGQLKNITFTDNSEVDKGIEFILKQNVTGDLVLKFQPSKAVTSKIALRFGFLEIDQNLETLDYFSQIIFQEKAFQMCWGDINTNKDYFYLKNSFYYITGTRDYFKEILESQFESEIQSFIVQKNNPRNNLKDVIIRGNYECLILYLDLSHFDEEIDFKTIVLDKELFQQTIQIKSLIQSYIIETNGFNYFELYQKPPIQDIRLGGQFLYDDSSNQKVSMILSSQINVLHFEIKQNAYAEKIIVNCQLKFFKISKQEVKFNVWTEVLSFPPFNLLYFKLPENTSIEIYQSVGRKNTRNNLKLWRSMEPIAFHEGMCQFEYNQLYSQEDVLPKNNIILSDQSLPEIFLKVDFLDSMSKNDSLSFWAQKSPFLYQINNSQTPIKKSPYCSLVFDDRLAGRFIHFSVLPKEIYLIPCVYDYFFDITKKKSYHMTSLKNEYGGNFDFLFIWPQMLSTIDQFWEEKTKQPVQVSRLCLWFENVQDNEEIIIENQEDMKISMEINVAYEIEFKCEDITKPKYKLLQIPNNNVSNYLMLLTSAEFSSDQSLFYRIRFFDYEENNVVTKYYSNQRQIQIPLKGSQFVEIESIFSLKHSLTAILLSGYIKKVFESSVYKLQMNFGANILVIRNSHNKLVIFQDNQQEQAKIKIELFEECIVIYRGNQMIGYSLQQIKWGNNQTIFGCTLKMQYSQIVISFYELPSYLAEQVLISTNQSQQIFYPQANMTVKNKNELFLNILIKDNDNVDSPFISLLTDLESNQQKNYPQLEIIITSSVEQFFHGIPSYLAQIKGTDDNRIILRCWISQVIRQQDNQVKMQVAIPNFSFAALGSTIYAQIYSKSSINQLETHPLTQILQLNCCDIVPDQTQKTSSKFKESEVPLLLLITLLFLILVITTIAILKRRTKQQTFKWEQSFF